MSVQYETQLPRFDLAELEREFFEIQMGACPFAFRCGHCFDEGFGHRPCADLDCDCLADSLLAFDPQAVRK